MVAFTLNSASSGGRQADITLPATVSAGDLLVAMHYDITNETIPTTPSGWTLINSFTGAGTGGTLGIIAKIADGTEGGASLSWFTGSDNNYAAFSLTPDATITSLGSVTGTDAASDNTAISLDATPSAGTLPLMLVYAGGSNGGIDVTPNGDFTERFTGTDGVELNATFYEVGDSTTTLTTNTGDTGRQTLVLGNLNLNFAVSVVVNVTGVSGVSAVGTPSISGKASTVTTGVSAAGQVNTVGISGKAFTSIAGASGTGQVNTVSVSANSSTNVVGIVGNTEVTAPSITGSSNTSLTGVAGITTVNSVNVSSDSTTTVTGVSANAELGIVEIDTGSPVTEVLVTGTQATGAIGSLSVSTQATINITLDAITSFIGTLATSSESNVSLNGVTANTIVNTVVVKIGAQVNLDSVAATTSVGEVGFKVSRAVTIDGVSGNIDTSNLIASGVVFDFEAIKENYSRNRTVYLRELLSTKTSYVKESQSRTVYVEAQSGSRTVYVEEEQSRTVYIEALSNSRKAYVAA